MAESLGKLRRTGVVLSLAVILAGCGGEGGEASDDNGTTSAEQAEIQTHLTPQELTRDQGGTVSQLPGSWPSLQDRTRYCRENRGETIQFSTAYTGGYLDTRVTCAVGDTEFVLGVGGPSEDTTFVYDELCVAAGGIVVDVATAEGADTTVQACHVKPIG